MKAAIFIAVEKYADQNIAAVQYAEADAREFATVLEPHGFEPADREILINGQATKTSIESVVRTRLKRLTTDDTLYLYYAGHGFSKIGGDNYITCFDIRRADPEHTSISLNWLFQQLAACKCQRIVMFLDSCHSGFLATDDWRTLYGALNEVELNQFFESAEHCVCFAACKADEFSHPSSDLKHGIWTYHVIQAFDGQNRLALDGYRLTSTSLQNYLKVVVPATLRNTNPKGVQTPWTYGAASCDFQLADLEETIARRKAAKNPRAGQVKDSILLAESIQSVKSLSGYTKSKGHFVPEWNSSRAQSFINELAATDIQADVESIRAALKREFGFKRLQVSVKNDGEGAATVTTPYFNYNVSVQQAPDDPGSVFWRRSLDAISDPDKVLSDASEAVFAGVFDTVELSLRENVDLDRLIDAIEALGSDEIGVDYDEDESVSSCIVTIKGQNVSIKVTQRTFSVVHPRAEAPKSLLQSLFDVQQALTHEHNVPGILFESADSTGR